MIRGKHVVLTGKVEGESRATAQAKLRDAGAIVQDALSKETQVLVTGVRVGAQKIAKAKERGIPIVPWEQAFAPAPGFARKMADPKQYLPVPASSPARTVAPMLAKKGDLPARDFGWLFEVKWDGYRGIATVVDGAVSIQSRSAKSDLTEQFPEIAKELASFPNGVYDGELVVLDTNGDSSFERMDQKGGASYVVFDLLELLGDDLRGRPLTERRELLEAAVASTSARRVTVSPAFDDGEALLAEVQKRGGEGVVAKRRASKYQEGSRGGDWVKVKIRSEQEFAVLGWLPGEGAMAGAAGSVILGVYEPENNEFVCAGRVGTGGEYRVWQAFTELPEIREGNEVGIDLNGYAPPKQAVWVELGTVVQVRFQRWTEDGRLWHPSLMGVRQDKSPFDCVREA